MKKSKELYQGYAQAYGNAYDIPQENIDLLKELFITPKWIKKPDTALKLSVEKLSKFCQEFQKELIESAISGNYQGLVFPNSKRQEEIFLKSNLPLYEQKRNELASIGSLAKAIIANSKL